MGTIHPRMYRLDASGCNGCDLGILEMPTVVPLARLGIEIVEAPEDASVLLVTGGANLKSAAEVRNAYSRMPQPCRVVAVGTCAATMGIFKGGYAMAGPIDAIVPVDLYVMGCPPRPQTLLHAFIDAFRLEATGLDTLLQPPPEHRGEPHVDESKCMGCGACAHVCPADAIEIVDSGAQRVVRFKRTDCVFCATCQEVCPSQAVEMRQPGKAWGTDKSAFASAATLPLAGCLVCGTPFVPAQQVQWVLRKLDETLETHLPVRTRLERSLTTCPTCRRTRIPLVTEAKSLLASMAERSHGVGRCQA